MAMTVYGRDKKIASAVKKRDDAERKAKELRDRAAVWDDVVKEKNEEIAWLQSAPVVAEASEPEPAEASAETVDGATGGE